MTKLAIVNAPTLAGHYQSIERISMLADCVNHVNVANRSRPFFVRNNRGCVLVEAAAFHKIVMHQISLALEMLLSLK